MLLKFLSWLTQDYIVQGKDLPNSIVVSTASLSMCEGKAVIPF